MSAYVPSPDDYEIHTFAEDVRSFPLGGDLGPVRALICRRCGCLVADFERHDEHHSDDSQPGASYGSVTETDASAPTDGAS